MIKVRQDLNAYLSVENKKIQKLKNDLKKDCKFLFEARYKFKNENKKLKTIIEQAKAEYQELYNE